MTILSTRGRARKSHPKLQSGLFGCPSPHTVLPRCTVPTRLAGNLMGRWGMSRELAMAVCEANGLEGRAYS